MLVAPEQAYFLRENLKLRLLNARLALLSRQFDTAQSDLRECAAALSSATSTAARAARQLAAELMRQVAGAGAPDRRCRGPTRRWRRCRPPPRPGAEPTAGLPPMRTRHLARAAVRGGRGRRDDAGQQRRPGQFLLERLAAGRVAESLPARAGGHLLRAGHADPGASASLVGLPRARPRVARRCGASAAAQACAARRAGAVFRRALQPCAQGRAARAGDPVDSRRTRAGRRIHRARPSARRRQPAPAAGPRRAATSSCGARSSLRAAQRAPPVRSTRGRGCWPPSGRSTTATRRARCELLASLPPGVGAAHAGAAPEAAGRAPGAPAAARRCKTARLLAKHQAFSQAAAHGLLRSLAFEALDAGARRRPAAPRLAAARPRRPARRLRRRPRRGARRALGAAERRPRLAAPVLGPLAELGATTATRWRWRWSTPAAACGADGCRGWRRAAGAIRARRRCGRRGHARCAERQLWGKARRLLEQAAADAGLAPRAWRRRAWRQLAALAREEGRRGPRRTLLRAAAHDRVVTRGLAACATRSNAARSKACGR